MIYKNFIGAYGMSQPDSGKEIHFPQYVPPAAATAHPGTLFF